MEGWSDIAAAKQIPQAVVYGARAKSRKRFDADARNSAGAYWR
jgi:hypothetical protein